MNSTDKIIFGVVAAFTIGIFVFIITSSLKTNKINSTAEDLVGENPHIKGNPNAKVKIVEFSDFECPACSSFYPYVLKLADSHPENLAIIYRHYPLPMHSRAIPTARAAEAAGMQGKFWDYHNKLFENFESYTDEDLLRYAESLGLDMEKFKADLASDQVAKNVSEDTKKGQELGVSGTPTFYMIVNDDVRLVNINQYGDLEAAVQSALQEVGEADANPNSESAPTQSADQN